MMPAKMIEEVREIIRTYGYEVDEYDKDGLSGTQKLAHAIAEGLR